VSGRREIVLLFVGIERGPTVAPLVDGGDEALLDNQRSLASSCIDDTAPQ
jgi:hypothetical protein